MNSHLGMIFIYIKVFFRSDFLSSTKRREHGVQSYLIYVLIILNLPDLSPLFDLNQTTTDSPQMGGYLGTSSSVRLHIFPWCSCICLVLAGISRAVESDPWQDKLRCGVLAVLSRAAVAQRGRVVLTAWTWASTSLHTWTPWTFPSVPLRKVKSEQELILCSCWNISDISKIKYQKAGLYLARMF